MNRKFLNLRKDIDEVDRLMLDLLSRRAKVVRMIGEEKLRSQIDVVDPERWNTHLSRLKEEGRRMDLDEDYVERIWDLIHKQSCKIQKDINLNK